MQNSAVDIEHHSRAWIPASIKMIAFVDAMVFDGHADSRCDKTGFLRSFDNDAPADLTALSESEFIAKSFEMRMDFMGRFSYE